MRKQSKEEDNDEAHFLEENQMQSDIQYPNTNDNQKSIRGPFK